MRRQSKWVYEFGPFRLDSAEQLLLRDGQPVPLKPKAFELLLLLVENGGRLLDKDLLMKQLWPDSFVEDGNLCFNICELRKALGNDKNGNRHIVTVPRRGYRLIVPVRRASVHLTEVARDRPRLSSTSNGDVGLAVKSIGVLPFKHIGVDTSDGYLGLGMADALITRLSNLRRVTVRPTSAVRRYKDETIDPVAAGRQLRVQSVLDGSIQLLGNRIRVTVQLVNVRDGMPLWAGKFEEEFTDVFAMEDSMAEQLAMALTVRACA